ncbi:peptidylprolyl isomerase [Ferrimonas sediminicola]|uniref:Peptidyl-prolyl cis-trans isomerase n=1 Tax=Ferrimonas sediminicola TaxID=2569538 RepID=A0A4U1BH30_9GAMM|nr:peptidylprolyl isomerase [Ferrimonas sediminicola]TKB50555.1 peptidylprolyl isomerase [Ferrimonas sediminicola]
MHIENNRVVSIAYTLRLVTGEKVDVVSRTDPLEYVHGQGQLADGLEEVLLGHKAGDHLTVTLTPELAFGDHDPALVKQVPAAIIKGTDQLKVGMQIQADTDQGPMELTLTAIDGDTLTLDANHPLAGKTVIFDVYVCKVAAPQGETANPLN